MLRIGAIRLGIAAMLLMGPAQAVGQTPVQSPSDAAAALSRRGAGARIGFWHPQLLKVAGTSYATSPAYELYMQRGIDRHVSLESAVGIWKKRSLTPQTTDSVTTTSYLVPIVTTLKVYPFTTSKVLLEPYLLGGGGFAIGFDNVSANALGGGGKSTAAGFGFKFAAGIEIHATHRLGASVAWRYQSVNFGDRIGGQQSYSGTGIEGSLTYRPGRQETKAQ